MFCKFAYVASCVRISFCRSKCHIIHFQTFSQISASCPSINNFLTLKKYEGMICSHLLHVNDIIRMLNLTSFEFSVRSKELYNMNRSQLLSTAYTCKNCAKCGKGFKIGTNEAYNIKIKIRLGGISKIFCFCSHANMAASDKGISLKKKFLKKFVLNVTN